MSYNSEGVAWWAVVEGSPAGGGGAPTAPWPRGWPAAPSAPDARPPELSSNSRPAPPGQPIPQEAWADVASERFCIAYQLDVAERIGAPASETEYLAGLTGDHCDVDLDGDCDWDDYYARDW